MSEIGRKLSFREKYKNVSTTVRKLSSMQVLEMSDANKILNISGRALLINIVILYGFGALSQFIPTFVGVFRRGFFCDDDSIRYPYKTDTVSTGVLMCYTIILDALVVVCVEFYRMHRIENAITQPQYQWGNNSIHALFVRFITYFGYSQIGFICNLTLTNITKMVIGRLRPHFIDVCRPYNLTCNQYEHIFINDYECTGDPILEKEGRKSFFSGHSSQAMYASVWAALYLQSRLLRACGNKILVPLIQTIVIGAGLAISYSRINDNMHHWSDVLVGVFVGSFIAIYTCVFWTGMFDMETSEKHSLLPTVDSHLRYGTDDMQETRPQPSSLQ